MAGEPKSPRYHVSSLYDEDGNVAAHFLNEEFYQLVDTWEHAMAFPQFASVIAIELEAEKVADDPLGHLAAFAPNDRVRGIFEDWLGFIDDELEPWTTGGAIHFRPHWARVLMNALVLGDALGLPEADLNCLAMASAFHDSRRSSPYLDTGHGARAAGYYADACRRAADAVDDGEGARGSAPLAFDPRTFLAMAWHDRDDEQGLRAAEQAVETGKAPGVDTRSYSELLPAGAQADAPTILRIFKDADGLDRVRLGEGGLDVRFLRTGQAHRQVEFARELLEASARPRA